MAEAFDVQIRSVPADRAAKHAVPLSEVVLQHHRADGVQIQAQPLTGGHLLHLAVAGCVFNDLYVLAEERGIRLTEVRVVATGGFEGEEPTVSTGVTYEVSVSGEASNEELRALVSEVDKTASIPDVLRQETAVSLSGVQVQATR
jgi:putative redox protein